MKKPRLSRRQVRAAAEKWPAKDTATIALELCVSEAAVWNSLDRIKSVSAEFLPKPPYPLNNAIGGAANIYPLTARPSAARRLSDPVEVAHRKLPLIGMDDAGGEDECVRAGIAP